MTYIIGTKSHGEIESGFFADFTQFARMGEYTFTTKHFCELAQYLSEEPDRREGTILSFDLNNFWKAEEEHSQGFIDQFLNKLAETSRSDLQTLVEDDQFSSQNDISKDNEVNLYKQGKIIQVKANGTGNSITIGDYNMSSLEFGMFISYLAGGGWYGWRKGLEPDFSKPTIEALKSSANPLYMAIQKHMSNI